MLLAIMPAFAGDLERARELYDRTDYSGALSILQKSSNLQNPNELLLAGQCWFMQGDFKKSNELFEKLVAAEPSNSNAYLWLGRAQGRRAETSNPLQAPILASRARQSFEKAVELNPKNREAIDDLFSYYLEAPGFLGGGLDKAAALAEKARNSDPLEYHYAMARIAEERKQYDAAEGQLHRAIDLAPKQASHLVELAKFLARRGRLDESEATFRTAENLEPANASVVFEHANTCVKAGKNLPEAKQLLRRYLSMNTTPDDPPKQEAQKLLASLSGG